MRATRGRWIVGAAAVAGVAGWVWANGGPFVVRYPNGDPAAKGVVAKIDPYLKPAREERLRVVKEDLKIAFVRDPMQDRGLTAAPANTPAPANGAAAPKPEAAAAPKVLEEKMPLALVSAIYTIENPTDEKIVVDFGFPILRGIYITPYSMMPGPDVRVQLDKEWLHPEVISNSVIYGIIRQRAVETIDKALAGDAELAKLVARVRTTTYVRQRAREAARQALGEGAALAEAVKQDESLARLMAPESDEKDSERAAARQALTDYLTGKLKWGRETAGLMTEFASVDPGGNPIEPRDRRGNNMWGMWMDGHDFQRLAYANMGRMAAIGEQKTTQLYAELAAKFDPSVKTAYEAIFSAWGGDVRERALDLKTGELRPREITVDPKTPDDVLVRAGQSDPTIYARVDYLDPNANLTPGEKASCTTVLKNLPVVFTFAPMNLVHYKVEFAAKSTKTLTVSYKQYAYADTRGPTSYQLAYVVHPASMWKDFGPIELEVAAPEGVSLRASVECQAAGTEERDWPEGVRMPGGSESKGKMKVAVYRGNVADKTGELFVALDAESWKKVTAEAKTATVSAATHAPTPGPQAPRPEAAARKAIAEKAAVQK